MTSTWMFPAAISVLVASATLAGVFWYLASVHREQYLRLWAASWTLQACRYGFLLVETLAEPHPELTVGYQTCALASAVFLIVGTQVFSVGRWWRGWPWLGAAGFAWVIGASVIQMPLALATAPVMALLAFADFQVGWSLMRSSPRPRSAVLNFTAICFFLWGAHKLDYPFARYAPWAAPLGYLVAGFFALATAVGIVLVFFERNRARLAESEQRWQFALEGPGDGVWDWNATTNRVVFSPRWKTMLGYEEADIGDTLDEWDSRLHPADREGVQAELDRHLRGESPVYESEHRLRCKDGTYRWILDRGKVMERSADGAPVRIVGTHRDITDRKAAEEQHERLVDQLIQARKMESVGRLAGGVAHDFNNMLSVIMAYAEIAMADLAPGHPLYDDLGQILQAATRSANLTRQLLGFARRQTVSPKVIDLNDSVSAMLEILRRLIGEDIDLLFVPGRDVGKIRIDPSQLDQILANLAANARDAVAERGALTIETTVVTLDATKWPGQTDFVAGDYVLLSVTDTGRGMTREVLDHVFEPFFTTKGVGKGTGLGLATVFGIVRQNNGYIDVYSEPDAGTTFRIYLPRWAEAEAKPAEAVAAAPRGGTESILLVEDDASILRVIQRMLEGAGYTVRAFEHPVEAVALVQGSTDPIDLLITDVVMPGMNGRELVERLRGMRPGLKSLYMSGYSANVIAHRGVLDEGVHFIPKPLGRVDLLSAVRKALEER